MKNIFPGKTALHNCAGAMLLISALAACEVKTETSPNKGDKPIAPQQAFEKDPSFSGKWQGKGLVEVQGDRKECTFHLDVLDTKKKVHFTQVMFKCADGTRAGLQSAVKLQLSVPSNKPYQSIYFNNMAVGKVTNKRTHLQVNIEQHDIAWELEFKRTKPKSNEVTLLSQRMTVDGALMTDSRVFKLKRVGKHPQAGKEDRDAAEEGTLERPRATDTRVTRSAEVWLKPKAATGYKNASHVLCKNGKQEAFIDFPNADLYEDSWGTVSGQLGSSTLGYRKSDKVKFASYAVEYPGVFTNGPETTLSAYDYDANLNLKVRSLNFKSGTGFLEMDGELIDMSCTFYQSPAYR